MSDLTPKQKEVLSFIESEIRSGRGFPGMDSISAAMHCMHYPSSAEQMCWNISRKGYLIKHGKGLYSIPKCEVA